MATQYAKEDDYTLLVTNTLPDGGTLSRFFNFAAEQVTTIYGNTVQKESTIKPNYSSQSGSTSVSVAVTSQMALQKFREFDNETEIRFMFDKLVGLKRKPPQPGTLPGKAAAIGGSASLTASPFGDEPPLRRMGQIGFIQERS